MNSTADFSFNDRYFHIARFKFIRDDVELIALVHKETGKQKLIIQQIDLKKNSNSEKSDSLEHKIIRQDVIDCIHTVLCELPLQKFIEEKDDANFYKKLINMRSSEVVKEVTLAPIEKFKALKSWVAGIAEVGKDAFQIQSDIDTAVNVAYPIVGRLLKFMMKLDRSLIFEFLSMIEKESIYQGVKYESFILANLNSVMEMLSLEIYKKLEKFERSGFAFSSLSSNPKENADITRNPLNSIFADVRDIIDAIFQIKPPLKLFTSNEKYYIFLQLPEAADLEGFNTLFNFPDDKLRLYLALNPRSADFDEFENFLLFATEDSWQVRFNAANHPNASRFNEYRFLFHSEVEPNENVRALMAGKVENVEFREYEYFFYSDLEPSKRVRAIAARNLKASEKDDYVQFLSMYTEPDDFVRYCAASNPNAPRFKEYSNFLSFETEPMRNVRMGAAANPYAINHYAYENFFSYLTEPDENVRAKAARLPEAAQISLFSNFLKKSKEPAGIVRFFAAENLNAPNHTDFTNLFFVEKEPYVNARRAAAKNPNAPKLKDFIRFLNKELEPDERTRLNAASNPNAVHLPQIKHLVEDYKRGISDDENVARAAYLNTRNRMQVNRLKLH